MNKLTIAIIEDEKPAARLLVSMLSKLRPEWDVKVLSGSVASSIEWFSTNQQPDLLFLDIQLNDGNSFVFLEQAQPSCPIIFTTAYDEYAIKAFSVNSIDYLLKPFDEKRLGQAITKFESLTALNHSNDTIIEALKSIAQKEKRYRSRFFITSSNNRSETVQVEEIAYIYSINRIAFAVCKNGREFIIDLSLDKLIEQLDPNKFYRANRQYILCIDAVRRIEPYFGGKLCVSVNPPASETITVSKEKVPQFKQWLDY